MLTAVKSFWNSPFDEAKYNADYCRAMLMALVIHLFHKDWAWPEALACLRYVRHGQCSKPMRATYPGRGSEMELHQFSGLDGIRRGRAKGVMVNSITGFMNALRKHRVVTDAGDHGSVTVWRDDKGKLHCDFSRWHSTVDGQVFETKAAVKKWLIEWFPKMRAQP